MYCYNLKRTLTRFKFGGALETLLKPLEVCTKALEMTSCVLEALSRPLELTSCPLKALPVPLEGYPKPLETVPGHLEALLGYQESRSMPLEGFPRLSICKTPSVTTLNRLIFAIRKISKNK